MIKNKIIKIVSSSLVCVYIFLAKVVKTTTVLAQGGVGLAGGDVEKLDKTQIDMFNPLKTGSGGMVGDGTNLGVIVNAFLNIAYGLATLILTVMLVWGGIEIMLSGTTGKSGDADNGKKRVKAAIIGFIITFASFFIMQLIQTLLKIKIVGF